MRRKTIGSIHIDGAVDITDPCYDRDGWCRMTGVKVKPGEYTCAVWHEKVKGAQSTYNVVGIIGVYLNGFIPPQKSMEVIGEIGVDAGLAGFFVDKPDFSDDEWDKFCNTLDFEEDDAWLNDLGFYSVSGYGDGGYNVYANKVNGEITALEIRFL